MKKTFVLLLILNLPIFLFAQAVQWGTRVGNAGYCGALGTAVDASGNIYTTGYFAGTVDFNPGAAVNNLVATGDYDAYLQKLDVNGNFVWAVKMGQTQGDRGEKVTIDVAGNIIVTGTSNGLFNLGLGRPDIAVWKYNSMGALQWSKKIGFNYFDYATSVTTDAANNIYIAGTFENTVDFNPGGTPQTLTSTGNLKDMYVLKLMANGNFRWVKQFVSATGNPEKVQQIKYNSGNGKIYFGGVLYGKTDFNPSIAIADTFYLQSNVNPSSKAVFISELDTAGNFINAVVIGDATEILFGDLDINAAGDKICLTGGYRATVDFNPGAGIFTMDAGLNVGTAIYACILNANLSFQSAFQLPSLTPFTNSVGLSVKFDNGNNLYLGGRCEGTVDLAPNAPTVNYTSNGGMDMFLIKVNSSNNFVYGGATGNATDQVVSGLDINSNGELYIIGSFAGTLNFDMHGGNFPMTATGLGDAYIVKYAPSFPLPIHYKSFNVELLHNNSVEINWVTSSEVGTSHFEIERSADASNWRKIGEVNAQGNSQVEANYQWTDKEIFTGTMYYRIKQVDIDGQFSYSSVEQIFKTTSSDINIYPNPCNMILNISTPANDQASTIEIYSLDGKRILSEQLTEANHKIDVNTLTKGTYMLRVFNSEKTFTTKFVRQ